MEKYYVSGCKDNGSETVTCDDNEAQFWTLYVRDDAGLSQGVIDCVFREDAEAAKAVYVERDALQEQVRALATECKAVYDHALEEGYQFYPGGIEYTDAALREIRADGAMACGVHLREWYDYQVEERAEEFAAAIRTGEQP